MGRGPASCPSQRLDSAGTGCPLRCVRHGLYGLPGGFRPEGNLDVCLVTLNVFV